MYEHVTRFIDDIERGVPGADIEVPLTHALYDPQIVDVNYRETLDANGLGGPNAPWEANIESLDLETTVALLTFVHRADHHQGGGFMGVKIDSGFVYRILLRLRELDTGYERVTLVPFHKENEWYGCFSNWHTTGFDFRGTRFATSEHWMMWQKARVLGDQASEKAVLAASHPSVAREIGRSVKPYDKVWDDVSEQLVFYGVREKFFQNERARNLLLSTGSALLCEAAPNDSTWGIGMSADDPDVDHPDKWRGENHLGRVLMRVRSDVRSGAVRAFTCEDAVDELMDSQVGSMTLLQLSRVPAAREAILTYTKVAMHLSGSSERYRDWLAKVKLPLREGLQPGLTSVAWDETLAELALLWKLGRL